MPATDSTDAAGAQISGRAAAAVGSCPFTSLLSAPPLSMSYLTHNTFTYRRRLLPSISTHSTTSPASTESTLQTSPRSRTSGVTFPHLETLASSHVHPRQTISPHKSTLPLSLYLQNTAIGHLGPLGNKQNSTCQCLPKGSHSLEQDLHKT